MPLFFLSYIITLCHQQFQNRITIKRNKTHKKIIYYNNKNKKNIVTNPTVLYAITNMQTMTNYPPELYDEILKDFNFRYGKFNPIPYPNYQQPQPNSQEETNNE